jgi:hypothetical protein
MENINLSLLIFYLENVCQSEYPNSKQDTVHKQKQKKKKEALAQHL